MAHGTICYLEIPARTGEDSAAFYSKISGWTISPAPAERVKELASAWRRWNARLIPPGALVAEV